MSVITEVCQSSCRQFDLWFDIVGGLQSMVETITLTGLTRFTHAQSSRCRWYLCDIIDADVDGKRV